MSQQDRINRVVLNFMKKCGDIHDHEAAVSLLDEMDSPQIDDLTGYIVVHGDVAGTRFSTGKGPDEDVKQ